MLDFTYKMTIAYDGTQYSGWQTQINAISIQSTIQEALSTILRTPKSVIASGRTDAGVHALAQIAHFRHSTSIDCAKILYSLNSLLPPDIRILTLDPAPSTFHARFSAKSKLYHYHLHLDPIPDPFQRSFTYRPSHPVDVELLKAATHYFIGTHDFTTFANVRAPTKNGNIRTIFSIEVIERKGGFTLAFSGNGFLYKMVRNIVGTLLEVSSHKITLEDIPRLFAARDRRAAGKAAPAQALFLIKVEYPQTTQNESPLPPHILPHESDVPGISAQDVLAFDSVP